MSRDTPKNKIGVGDVGHQPTPPTSACRRPIGPTCRHTPMSTPDTPRTKDRLAVTVRPCPAPHCTLVDDLGNPLPITTPLCDSHRHDTERALTGAPELYTLLNQQLATSGSGGLAEQVSVSRDLPIPISTTTRAMQETLVELFRDTERRYRLARGLTAAQPLGREGAALQARARFLNRHLDQILELPFGPPFAIELLTLRHQARRALGLTRHVERLREPCPSCDAKGLERVAGASDIGCRSCAARFGEDEYARLQLVRAGLAA